MPDPLIPIPETLESKTIYKGHFEVKEDLLQLPKGLKKIYSVLETDSEAVAILAETSEGEFVLNKEYRHPTRKWLYGCPGGSVDPGESPLKAAQRELLEETGYSGSDFELLGSAYPYPAHSSQLIHYVWAKDVKLTHSTAHEPFEFIKVELKRLSDFQREIKEGAYIDGILCSALYFREIFHRP